MKDKKKNYVFFLCNLDLFLIKYNISLVSSFIESMLHKPPYTSSKHLDDVVQIGHKYIEDAINYTYRQMDGRFK